MSKKILLACCGTSTYTNVIYRFQDDKSYNEYKYSFFKIANYLNIKDIYLLLTPEASDKHKKNIFEEANNLGLNEPNIIAIETPKNEEDIWKQFDNIINCLNLIDDKIEVSLDITFAFRHIPLLLFTSMVYLESCNKAVLNGIYYGAKEAQREDNTVPILNIERFSNILRGSFAVKQFEKTGHISEIKDFINVIQKDLTSKKITIIGKNSTEYTKTVFDELKGEFDELQGMILNGLPFESGIKARTMLQKLNEFDPSNIEVIKNLLQRLCNSLEPIAIKDNNWQLQVKEDSNLSFDIEGEKKKIQLTIDELKRQLEFIKLVIFLFHLFY